MKRFRRRQFLVDNFQKRLLLVSFIYFGATLLVFAGAMFLPLMVELQNDATTWDEKQLASEQFLALHGRLWPAIFVLFTMLAVHSVILSHRVAGPLFQFRRIFRSIAEGDLSVRVAIRKKDYLKKEEKDINDMIASLRQRIERCSEANEKAHAALSELRESAASGSVTDVNRLSGHLEVHLARLEEELGGFRTTTPDVGESEASAEAAALEESASPVSS